MESFRKRGAVGKLHLRPGWYMLWNCGQISDEHREKLASGATRIALKFPARSLTRFRQKFGDDPRITTAVDLQLYGNADLFAEFARTLVASQRAKKVASWDILRRFFIARAQVVISRFARVLTTKIPPNGIRFRRSKRCGGQTDLGGSGILRLRTESASRGLKWWFSPPGRRWSRRRRPSRGSR